jgi:hypothetical protein
METKHDRIHFAQDISTEKTPVEDIIKKCFDEVMSLYNIIGNYTDNNVTSDFDDLSFQIAFESEDEAKTILAATGTTHTVNIYGRQFSWSIQHKGKALIVHLL